jgi:hypothetical protein
MESAKRIERGGRRCCATTMAGAAGPEQAIVATTTVAPLPIRGSSGHPVGARGRRTAGTGVADRPGGAEHDQYHEADGCGGDLGGQAVGAWRPHRPQLD